MAESNRDHTAAENEDGTDLPVLHAWAAVYAFVLGVFFVWIVLLTVLSGAFS